MSVIVKSESIDSEVISLASKYWLLPTNTNNLPTTIPNERYIYKNIGY